MTVDNEIARTDAVGAGNTDTYPYNFKILDQAELKVVTTTAAGVSTTLTLTTDYTVDGVGDTGGGDIVLTAGDLTTGVAIAMTRDMDFTQELSLTEQGTFSLRNQEQAFDRLTMMMIQLKEMYSRTLKLSDNLDGDDFDIELPEAEADTMIGWNSDGTALENIDPGSVALAIPATGSVDNTVIADMPEATFKMRAAGAGTGDPIDGTATQARTALSLVPDGTTVESSGTTLQVKDLGIGAGKLAATVISGQTAETAPAIDDLLILSDTSASANRKMTAANFLKVINGLTADATPDSAADYVMTYDASASAVKKVLITNIIGTAAAASTTASGIIELATAAEVQTGSDAERAVCPSTANYHQSACKAWVHFNGTGTPTAADSYNISSITDNGAGDYTLNFTVAMNNANFAMVGTSCGDGSVSGVIEEYRNTGRAAGTVRIRAMNLSATLQDREQISVLIFGDLP